MRRILMVALTLMVAASGCFQPDMRRPWAAMVEAQVTNSLDEPSVVDLRIMTYSPRLDSWAYYLWLAGQLAPDESRSAQEGGAFEEPGHRIHFATYRAGHRLAADLPRDFCLTSERIPFSEPSPIVRIHVDLRPEGVFGWMTCEDGRSLALEWRDNS